MTFVVDTNVILVANGQHPDVSPQCVASCSQRLAEIKAKGRVAIDDRFLILLEYQQKTNPRRGKQAGDAFVKWVLQSKATPARCDQVAIVDHPTRGFESFPDDDRLAHFDPPDRMFVAVAAAHPERPPILQAADSKWLDWSPALAEHGVHVEFVCRDDVERFHRQKFGS